MQAASVLRPVMSERRVSIIGAVLAAIGPVSMSLFTPAMPSIVAAFDTSPSLVKMALSLYFAGFAFAQLICGPLSDGFGRKPIVMAFMGIYLLGSVIALLSPTIEVLIAARFIQGCGAAVGISVARAVVRDLFARDRSARIMNLIGMIMASGPALAPTLGGIAMGIAGWHSIFVLMAVAGSAILVTIHFTMRETVVRDLNRIRPLALLASYRQLLTSPYFVLCSVILGGTVGSLYTLATILPFILMERLGVSPPHFGLLMLCQSGGYFTGAIVARQTLHRFPPSNVLAIGLVFISIGSMMMAVLPVILPLTLPIVMGPVGICAFGIAFVTPVTMTAALVPYPHIAGSAASMSGFFQMGGGLVGGTVCALVGDPVLALHTVVPAMGAISLVSWLIWRRLPEPSIQMPR
jgi:MFS transporter, DHA1 family, multidrug resistance protein